MARPVPRDPATHHLDLGATAELIARVQTGDSAARNDLVARFLPLLHAWARGRLPRWARSCSNTDDLVQVTLLKALDRMGAFEPRRPGAFLAYLRRILTNRIRDEIRQLKRKPRLETLPDDLAAENLSPLERAIGSEAMAAYEAALDRLDRKKYEAVVLRIEFGFTHAEVAEAMELASADAARMMVARALRELAQVMHEKRIERSA